MDSEQAQSVIRRLAASFRQSLTADQVVVWVESLARLDYDAAREAVNVVRDADEFLPSHARFLVAVEEIEVQRRQATPALSPAVCGLCGGAKFVETDVETNTVRPCKRCNPIGHSRWREGHYLPDHHCAECAELRAGGSRTQDALRKLRERV